MALAKSQKPEVVDKAEVADQVWKAFFKTGERYLPKKAIESLTASEYASTTKAKRKGTKAGKQFVKQPKAISAKVKRFR